MRSTRQLNAQKFIRVPLITYRRSDGRLFCNATFDAGGGETGGEMKCGREGRM